VSEFKYIFTITAGRTGTAWLTDFLSGNLGIPAVHEPLAIEDEGVNMPSIKIMRTFNCRGNTDVIRGFWRGKLARVAREERYAETNHTLAKCGLIEHVSLSPIRDQTLFVALKRDRVDQCMSYVSRNDFSNTTLLWQWYLAPNYPTNIVPFQPFDEFTQLNAALWYTFEMEARQRYYIRQFGDRIRIMEVDLEKLVSPTGARKMLKSMGIHKKPYLPDRTNAYPGIADDELRHDIARQISRMGLDLDAMVDGYIRSGGMLTQMA